PMSLQYVNVPQAALLELSTPRDPAPPAPPDPSLFPDYQFLVLAGTKGQTQLTRKEFETWARTYARQLADLDYAKRQYDQAQVRFKKAKSNKGKAQAEQEGARHLQEYQNLQAQLNAIPAAVHRALGVKR